MVVWSDRFTQMISVILRHMDTSECLVLEADYETLLCRFARARARGRGSWHAPFGSGHHVPGQSVEPHALACFTPGQRRGRATPCHWRPRVEHHPAQHEELRKQVAACPDATIAEHTEQWNASHSTCFSPSTVGRAIRRLALTRKKSH